MASLCEEPGGPLSGAPSGLPILSAATVRVDYLANG